MNKTNALKFAKEYIENMLTDSDHIDIKKPFQSIFNPQFLEDDPNFEILNSELNKIGYKITKTENSTTWTISKL